MLEAVFASGNACKYRELQSALREVTLHPQSEFAVDSVSETGSSFLENALLKARHAARACGMPAIADDSGLSVKALRGAPGIFSARFARPQASDDENNSHLLELLKDTPRELRQARFICVMVYVAGADDPLPITAQGEWSGWIGYRAKGTAGFGYDPVFMLPDGRSVAELSTQEKNALSHRGRAIAKLKRKLATVARRA